jgi:hypothetical protein
MAGLALAIDLLLQQQQPAIASKGLHSFSALSALAASAAAAASAVSPAHSSLFAHFDARCVLYILRDPLCGPLHGTIVSSFLIAFSVDSDEDEEGLYSRAIGDGGPALSLLRL